MKSLTELLQRSFSSWGTKLASLALIITAALFSLAAGTGDDNNQERGNHQAPGLEWTWLTTVTIPDGPPPFPVLVSFSAGGAFMATDSGVPPALGNVYQGTWARTGNREFTFTFLAFQFVPPVPDTRFPEFYYFRHHETIRLDRSGETYDSIAGATEFLDSNYNVTDGPFIDPPGVTHGMRLHAQ